MKLREAQLGEGIHIKHGFDFKGEFFSDSGQYIVLTPGNFNEQGGFRIRPGKDRAYWRDKETTRDDVRIAIHDFLYSDATGLPLSSYSEAEVGARSESVFRHFYWAYPTVPSPYYGAQA